MRHNGKMLAKLIQFSPRDVPLRVALRNTLAIVLPLALGIACGQIEAGLGVATGALTTMFADQPGPYRLRALRMLLTTLAAALSALIGSLVGGNDPLMVLAALLWGLGGGLLVALGADAARAGLTAMILLVITSSQPRTPEGAGIAAALIFLGGTLQTLFAIAAWPLQRYRPERQAIAQMCRQLAASARDGSHAGDAPPVTREIVNVESLLHGAYRARGEIMQTFRVLAELLERARRELITLTDLRSAMTDASVHAALSRLLDYAARVLETTADALDHGTEPLTGSAAMAGIESILDELTQHRANPALADSAHTLGAAIGHAQALSGQLRALLRNAGLAGSRGELRAQQAEAGLPRALRPRSALATLRANLALSSIAFRHALRCGVCLAIAVAIERMAGLAHGYWIPMTLAIVLKPDFAGTFHFGLLRVAGTLAGLVLTTITLHFALGSTWSELALLALLCVAYRMLVSVHYGLGVMWLTGIVVILLAFSGIAPMETMFARSQATAIGCAAALLAYVIWPTWEHSRLKPALAAMLDAYRHYFLALLDADAQARAQARSLARNARTNAQASIERLRNEPRPNRALLAFAEGVFANANRFVRAGMSLDGALHGTSGSTLHDDARPIAQHMARLLGMQAEHLRSGTPMAPIDEMDLRTRERAFARQLRDAGHVDGTDAAARIAEAFDRLTDSVDTLDYLLREGTLDPPSRQAPSA